MTTKKSKKNSKMPLEGMKLCDFRKCITWIDEDRKRCTYHNQVMLGKLSPGKFNTRRV